MLSLVICKIDFQMQIHEKSFFFPVHTFLSIPLYAYKAEV